MAFHLPYIREGRHIDPYRTQIQLREVGIYVHCGVMGGRTDSDGFEVVEAVEDDGVVCGLDLGAGRGRSGNVSCDPTLLG